MSLEYSIHDFLGSCKTGSSLQGPIRFAEVSLQGSSFVATGEDIDDIIHELEEALAVVDKM